MEDDVLNRKFHSIPDDYDEDSFSLPSHQPTPVAKKVRLDDEVSASSCSWPDESGEGDSIFLSDALTAVAGNAEEPEIIEDENRKYRQDEDDEPAGDPIQCTQRFISDVNYKKLDYSKYFCGSQYTTREDLRQKQEKTRTFFQNVIQEVCDISWGSQAFPVEIQSFSSKGPFYGLPVQIEKMIYEQKRITTLYDWQKECLQLPAIEKRKNLIYALPTSGGKTLVAEILMLREIICREKNVIFILPYVSIVQEKVSAMAPFAYKLDFLVEEYTSGKGRCPPMKRRKRRSIFICSIEKGAILFDSLIEANRANEVGLVVVDEMHLIGEKGRGPTLEAVLTKIKYLKAGIQVVGMSATIGNLPELSAFLDADIYTRGFRPVELKEYVKCGCDILKIDANGREIEEIFAHERTVSFKYSSSITKADPDHLAGLVSEVIPQGSCLIFCSTRKNCENVAVLLSKILPENPYGEHKKAERAALMDAIEKLCGSLSPVLKQTIPYGIAYHHSGLTTEERRLLETGYRFGTLCVICCTSTLAAGVNLPAKRVIIRAPFVGSQFMTLCQYKQMVGRAGRAGMGEAGESILICSSKYNLQVGQMLFSPMDEVISSMNNRDSIGLQNLILSAIGLKLADCLKDLLQLAAMTLLAVQSTKVNVLIEAEVTGILRCMFRHKILKVCSKKVTPLSLVNEIVTTQEIKNNEILDNTIERSKHVILSKSTKFELTTIGRAAYKAGVDYKKAEAIYNELKTAQSCLVLRNFTHLLYLVVSYSSNDDIIYPDAAILFREYNNLDKDTQCVAKTLGITEPHMVRMAKTNLMKGPVEKQLTRFFKVLILNDVLNLMATHITAAKYGIDRGAVQSLINQAISAAASIMRLCEEIDEFWCYGPLFEKLFHKLDYCCTAELAPLLDLPCVKLARAKQLYAAGYRTLEDIAKAKARELSLNIEYLPYRVAQEIVSAAKVHLINKLEVLQEETDAIISCLQ